VTLRILIPGAMGFVGGRLAVHLDRAGHQIVLGSRKIINPPAWLPNAEVTQIKWDDSAALENSCRDVDIVIQAAGMNAQECVVDPVSALAFNGVATANLMAAACRMGVQKFIYLSTAHVYASSLAGLITEDTCPRNLHPYATSHLAGEQAVLGASRGSITQGIVLRLSNVFGPPTHIDANCWMLLVNDLCKQAVQTHNLVLYSSGHQQRDFISMTEVCHSIEALTTNEADDHLSGIFNIGSGVSQSILTMAKNIQQRCVQVLGFEPKLDRKQDAGEDIPSPFQYQIVRLESVHSPCHANGSVSEIDSLLRFCDEKFNRLDDLG
jgi:UDP-glucose 4-epimerase